MTTLTSLPAVSRLSNKIIRILGCNPGPMTLQGTNTYLVGTGARRALIDTGDIETCTAYTELLYSVLREEKATIEHVIITHWHHDHIGGVNSVKNLLKTKLNSRPITIWKLPRTDTNEDTLLSDNDWKFLINEQVLEVEGSKLQVKHTPGHTTDHVCLLIKEENILFSGDCILGEGTAVFEDLHDYMQSLTEILEMKPSIIYPGHGPVLENPISRIKYYIQHRQQREMEILKILKEHNSISMSEMDIVQIIYKETPKNLWPAAASNVEHHLTKLLKEKKVIGKRGEWKITKNTEL